MGADAAMFRRLQARSGGLIKLVDVAPRPGNLDFIQECRDEVRISIAHTCTSYDTARPRLPPVPPTPHLYDACRASPTVAGPSSYRAGRRCRRSS